MKRLLTLPLLFVLIACPEPREKIYVRHKYSVGIKVLMKTGDRAVIIETKPWWLRNWYHKGDVPLQPEYVIRVGFVKRTHKTDSLLDGRRTIHTDVTKFTVKELEIERVIE